MTISDRIMAIEKDGLKVRGKSELINYLKGDRLTHKEAIRAKCYECMCCFIDGRQDCGIPGCPLYPFMIFNPAKKEPRRKKLTPEHIRKLQVGRKRNQKVSHE